MRSFELEVVPERRPVFGLSKGFNRKPPQIISNQPSMDPRQTVQNADMKRIIRLMWDSYPVGTITTEHCSSSSGVFFWRVGLFDLKFFRRDSTNDESQLCKDYFFGWVSFSVLHSSPGVGKLNDGMSIVSLCTSSRKCKSIQRFPAEEMRQQTETNLFNTLSNLLPII